MTRFPARFLRTAFAVLAAGLVAGAWACAPATAPPSPEDAADLIVTRGRVYTFRWDEPAPDGTPAANAPHSADGWSPDAEAVAVKDGKIVFVGAAEEADAYRGENTHVIDAQGATVLPGLVDSHTHVVGLGELQSQVNLMGVETEEEAVERVVAASSDVPEGQWIVGRGWDEGAWANRYPNWDLLNEKFPDNPVVLNSLHSFAVWGNRKAFEDAGITKSTPSPEGGEIVKDARGELTGILLNRAGRLLMDAIPDPSLEELKSYVVAGLETMAQVGYVAVHEAGADTRLMRAFEELETEGALPIRVYAMLSARDESLCRAWIEKGADQDDGTMLTTRSVKAFYDGALGSRGARLLEDYSDVPGHRGVAGDEYGFDQALLAEMMKSGFQAAIHAIGDAGNRETLDFIESVVEDAPESRELRHRIEHAQVLHPQDISRFAELNVIASMEPPHAVEDKTWAEERLGAERIKGAYAWRSLREVGAHLTFNSDLIGSDHDIFYGLHAAITRRDKELQPPGGWYPEQTMTPEEAVRGYTVWSAYAAFWESHTGVLEPGRWGDITIMDLDPLVVGSTQAEKLLGGRILATIVNGNVVHDAME